MILMAIEEAMHMVGASPGIDFFVREKIIYELLRSPKLLHNSNEIYFFFLLFTDRNHIIYDDDFFLI